MPHHDGVESNPRSGARSLYTYTWIWWMSSRKPHPARETITPIAAANTSNTMKLRLRRIAAGSGAAAGASSGVPVMEGNLGNGGRQRNHPIHGLRDKRPDRSRRFGHPDRFPVAVGRK